jgi:formylglycine-generating enzyme required for sulfatase activity
MRARLLVVLALALAAVPAACGSKTDAKKSHDESDDDETEAKPKKKKAASATAAATASESAPTATASASAAPAGSGGPTVTIPAGNLLVGHACGAVPRVTDEELVHPSVALGEFTIDAYPYPNDPAQPPKLGVARAEAESLCQAAGKRLCSELEWERACKGATNATFEYGAAYDSKACAPPSPLALGKRDKCKSPFGVFDLHGVGFEWTSSPWGRGKTAGFVTVRGYSGTGNNVVRERCASGVGRDPARGAPDTGFRCCSGTTNPAVVDLPLSRLTTVIEDASVPGDTVTDLLKKMPPDHQKVDGATVSFDRLWRWHPRDNEELVVARWVGRPEDKKPPFYELEVFKVCGGVPTRVTGMRGPVGKTESLREDGTPEKVSIDVSTKDDKGKVTLSYWYGSVKVVQPDWVQAGNKLDLGDDRVKKRPSLVRPIKIRPKVR